MHVALSFFIYCFCPEKMHRFPLFFRGLSHLFKEEQNDKCFFFLSEFIFLFQFDVLSCLTDDDKTS